MRRFNSPIKNGAYAAYRWMKPVADPLQVLLALPRYGRFFVDWFRYKSMKESERTRATDTFPCLNDRTPTHGLDAHYFFQDRWAFRKVVESGAGEHVDVGSRLDFIGFLSVLCKVTFVDIRPLTDPVDNVESRKGSILAMPYPDDSVQSLSCLHVAEHIGLGRYGDPLDPAGTRKACAELARVLAANGNLYFSLPVGKPRLCFNAHRIHSPGQILEYFAGLSLTEFSAITDDRQFVRNISPSEMENSDYACGLFHFVKLRS
jgi:hypothetical protein